MGIPFSVGIGCFSLMAAMERQKERCRLIRTMKRQPIMVELSGAVW